MVGDGDRFIKKTAIVFLVLNVCLSIISFIGIYIFIDIIIFGRSEGVDNIKYLVAVPVIILSLRQIVKDVKIICKC